jgi:hypothetical protein
MCKIARYAEAKMNKEYYDDHAAEVLNEAFELVKKKHRDYGTSNLKRHGLMGINVRLFDKLARVENLQNTSAAVNESQTDTYMDMLGYCLQAILMMRGQYDLPLRPNGSISDVGNEWVNKMTAASRFVNS